jgi:hypothetical protein
MSFPIHYSLIIQSSKALQSEAQFRHLNQKEKVKIEEFLTSQLYGGGLLASLYGRFTPGERAPVNRRLSGFQSRSECGGVSKTYSLAV